MHNKTINQQLNKPIIVEKSEKKNWLAKVIALIALVNFLLVLFNLSYIHLRDFYFQKLPAVVQIYDPWKKIEAHPDTTHYLQTVDLLTEQINEQGLEAPLTEELFAELRQESVDLLTENPFLINNKLGTLAKLEGRMEYRLNTLSTKEAFNRFWTSEYFAQVSPSEALTFFDSKIRPLLELNYFRNIDENGQFIDEFWKIDIFFNIFFAIEFFTKTLWNSTNQRGISWLDVMLRRWYDILMFVPILRWSRIISVAVRLHQSGLINLQRIISQLTHEPVAYFAERASMFLMVRLINQTQEAVETGEATRALLSPGNYVQLGEIDKIDAITDRILDLAIYKVLPQVQPDVEALLRHSLKGTFQQSDFYQSLTSIPGLAILPADAAEQLADYLAESAYEVMINSYSDIEGRELFENLTEHFKQTLRRELQDKSTQSELQSLLSQLLEELKINYIQGSTKKDPEATLSEAEEMRSSVEAKS